MSHETFAHFKLKWKTFVFSDLYIRLMTLVMMVLININEARVCDV